MLSFREWLNERALRINGDNFDELVKNLSLQGFSFDKITLSKIRNAIEQNDFHDINELKIFNDKVEYLCKFNYSDSGFEVTDLRKI